MKVKACVGYNLIAKDCFQRSDCQRLQYGERLLKLSTASGARCILKGIGHFSSESSGIRFEGIRDADVAGVLASNQKATNLPTRSKISTQIKEGGINARIMHASTEGEKKSLT